MKKRFHQLNKELPQAYLEGKYDLVKVLAQEFLALAEQFTGDWNYGNAIHIGNISMGLVAMQEGHIALAKDFLLNAGRTKGSPQLNTFGPNMLLAKSLLEIGKQEVVLMYLELCEKFWLDSMRIVWDRPLKRWKQQIENGRMPDFGANLVYGMSVSAQ